jgi:hypothetical protein
MKTKVVFLFFILNSLIDSALSLFKDDELQKPDQTKCKNRPREFNLNGKNYFYSKHHNATSKAEFTWLQARNYCRAYCMDTIAVNSQKEWDLIYKIIEDNSEDYIWTSGHECFKEECLSDKAFNPRGINGFYWTLDNSKIPPTDKTPPSWKLNPWSQTGK